MKLKKNKIFIYNIYYQLVSQYLYLLLLISSTSFSHNSWPSSVSGQVSSIYTAYAKVVDFIHQCSNIIKILKNSL